MITRLNTAKMEAKANLLLNKIQSSIKSIQLMEKTTEKFGDNIPASYNRILLDNYQAFQNSFDELEQILCEPTVSIDCKELFDLKFIYDSVHYRLLASIGQPQPVDSKPVITKNLSNLKLPRLTISKFNGDFMQWINFKALFEASVHNSDQYSESQKLQILLSHLEGVALALVDTIPISDNNYSVAYKLLCDKYDNVRSAANFHYSRLYNFKSESTEQETIRMFSSTFRSSINALESLGIDLKDFLLLKLAMHALPQNLRSEFERQCLTDSLPTIEQLLKFVNHLEKSYETSKYDDCDNNVSPHMGSSQNISSRLKQNFTRQSNSLLVEKRAFNAAKAKANPHSHNFSCIYCKSEGHNIFMCTDFLLFPIEERYSQISRLKLCFNCFGRHQLPACKSVSSCKICHSPKHHTLLHRHDMKTNVGLVTSAGQGTQLCPRTVPQVSHSPLEWTQSLPVSSMATSYQNSSQLVSPVVTHSDVVLPQAPWVGVSPSMNVIPSATYTAPLRYVPHKVNPCTYTTTAIPASSIITATAPLSSAPAVNNDILTSTPNQGSMVNNLSCKVGNKSVLLGTAVVEILDSMGNRNRVRAVLDSGSEATIITTRAVQRLGLPIQHSSNQILGLSACSTPVRGQAKLQLRSSRMPTFHATCEALVVPSIVGKLPSSCLPDSLLEQFCHQELADPNFIHSSDVDLLLGADIYSELVVPSQDVLIHGSPSTLCTVFGLVVFGRVNHVSNHTSQQTNSLLTTLDPIHKTLQKFWEIEEVQLPAVVKPEDALCEQLFQATTARDKSGRYIVSLPFKVNSKPLNNNSSLVSKQYQRFEARLASQPETYSRYHEFMQEYINLQHMSVADRKAPYLIPHHCVLKESSSTTKLRTVFNASYSDGQGNSLNSQLLPGPKLQQDISNILISFRSHRFVICSDIKMMYRQILVHPQDRLHQHILYRPHPQQPIQEYELNTVTYGLTPSAYLAQRVLLQLVLDEGDKFPQASHAIKNHMYVDDILSGANSIDEARDLVFQLIELFALGGFDLRKWSSNEETLLNVLPQDHLEQSLSFTDDSPSIKILGLQWTPSNDSFSYHITPFDGSPTKRNILSYTACMFDPLGLLAPVIFWAKYFLQKLWQASVSWDDPLPPHLGLIWSNFASQLPAISQISLPRFIGQSSDEVHLIGFCDASERGYAAVLYIRTVDNHLPRVTLLKSKTRVAPVKTMTIPRLELCAALLLAKLYESVMDSFSSFPCLQIHLFSDAQIVLTWLQTPPHQLKIFVSNRVQQILAITPLFMWKHVPTHLNPADLASRGAAPQDLIQNSFWWTGPQFLLQPVEQWPVQGKFIIQDLPELRQEKVVLIQQKSINSFIDVFSRQSSYLRLLRTMAYVLRFIRHTRNSSSRSPSVDLSVSEIRQSRNVCIRLIQSHHFSEDIQSIKSQKSVSRSLLSLTPFIDPESGILRAGGRLINSNLPPNAKQPIILPKKSHFTEILCVHYHALSLHAGPRATQAIINQEFWIPGLRSSLRWLIHNCVRCLRYHKKPVAPLMASLPPHRVSALRPFQAVGLDFAGPFSIKNSLVRNAPITKGYLCIFICMSTKAAHLECVSDLSSEAFLAAFNRFISRRGLPSDVYSDNGTNFVGAASNIQELYQFLQRHNSVIRDQLSSQLITWHFNPPYAPNFGGLWEAAVKSAKHHLHRVMHNRSLTFEEFSTLLTRIEAVMNSRPLFEPSPDPNESHLTLTPGHFLIGTSLLQPPEEEVTSRLSLRSRWNLLRHLFQSFWKTWAQHYLHSVIQRNKWNKPQPTFQVGQLVIMYQPPASPSDWPLAKITAIHPSKDGTVRVVTLRTSQGEYTRAVNRLIPIPSGSDF